MLSQQFDSDLWPDKLLLFLPKLDLACRSDAERRRPSPESLLPVRVCDEGPDKGTIVLVRITFVRNVFVRKRCFTYIIFLQKDNQQL